VNLAPGLQNWKPVYIMITVDETYPGAILTTDIKVIFPFNNRFWLTVMGENDLKEVMVGSESGPWFLLWYDVKILCTKVTMQYLNLMFLKDIVSCGYFTRFTTYCTDINTVNIYWMVIAKLFYEYTWTLSLTNCNWLWHLDMDFF